MVKSTVKPEPIWLRRKDGLLLTLRARWNIKEVQVEDTADEAHTEFEYDEQEITHAVPNDITPDTLSTYIKAQTPKLIEEAKNKQVVSAISQPVIEKTLTEMTIEDLRGIV